MNGKKEARTAEEVENQDQSQCLEKLVVKPRYIYPYHTITPMVTLDTSNTHTYTIKSSNKKESFCYLATGR